MIIVNKTNDIKSLLLYACLLTYLYNSLGSRDPPLSNQPSKGIRMLSVSSWGLNFSHLLATGLPDTPTSVFEYVLFFDFLCYKTFMNLFSCWKMRVYGNLNLFSSHSYVALRIKNVFYSSEVRAVPFAKVKSGTGLREGNVGWNLEIINCQKD